MRLISILLVTVVGIVVSSDVCKSRAPAGQVNGCSVPSFMPHPFIRIFTSSCDKHDVCYDCAAYHGISRKQCDESFRRAMNNACFDRCKHKRFLLDDLLNVACLLSAHLYFVAVRFGGATSYLHSSPKYCEEDWVNQCLPNV
ncbi:conodipine-P1-like [Saccostrea cucullata]|uniref:conodipine-P1-like n=1 Tax=Saccostrea cuccullata TaxID=36930 RepID=UPI002ED2B740